MRISSSVKGSLLHLEERGGNGVDKRKAMTALGAVVLVCCALLLFGTGGRKAARVAEPAANAVAVVYVDGMITGSRAGGGLFDEGGTDALIKRLHQAAKDRSVKAIVLRINSPGGSTAATEEVAAEIAKIRADGKFVVTSMGDIAASGGYWLAASTDKIYANATTLTGSIGVYMPYSNWEELYRKIGIRQEKIKSGPHKDILSPDREMTAEERQILQGMVDEIYEAFVDVVAEGRHMDREAVKKLADGRVFTGRQAQQAGLVDELGNLYDAVDGAAALAGLSSPQIKEYGRSNPFSTLFSASGKAELLQEFLGAPDGGGRSLAPLAVPEKWLGE